MKNWQSRVQQSDLRRVYSSFEEVMEMGMTPTQKEVFLVIDEFWKKFGYSPSIKDIAYVRGKMGIGNTHKIVNRLVKLGAVKKVKGMARSIRPVYVNFKNME
jgi:SOS-response transcriptional repressor LexA